MAHWKDNREAMGGDKERPKRPESAFIIEQKSLPPPPDITPKQFAQQARDKGLWIFDTAVKRWFTPDEFLSTYERYTTGFETHLAKMQIRNPVEGIEAAHIQIKDINARLEIFSKRIIEYYKKKG